MSDLRAVPLSSEQATTLEEIAFTILRRREDFDRVSGLLAIALAWRVSPPVRDIELPPDPSLADVVELHGHSRKVGA